MPQPLVDSPTQQPSPQEVRFAFGKNWAAFLSQLTQDHIDEAVASLKTVFQRDSLLGLSFLDVGSGSGLFSLAARQLGAHVHSFDYDSQSVACTQYLKERFYAQDDQWLVEQGSILDKNYLKTLGRYDIVYSWGVLHHTGHMAQAFEHVASLVKPDGHLLISIYNDQGGASRRWLWVKRVYTKTGPFVRAVLIGCSLVRLWAITIVKDTVKTGNPLRTWRAYKTHRGMSAWYDVVDWVGGYPFEVATPGDVFTQFYNRGFQLRSLKTLKNGSGCNEFLFKNTQ